MFCPHCGKENANSSRFCFACGAPLPQPAQQQAPQQQPVRQQPAWQPPVQQQAPQQQAPQQQAPQQQQVRQQRAQQIPKTQRKKNLLVPILAGVLGLAALAVVFFLVVLPMLNGSNAQPPATDPMLTTMPSQTEPSRQTEPPTQTEAAAQPVEQPAEQPAETEPELPYELSVTIWCPDAARELTKKQIEDFNRSNTYNIHVTARIDTLSEADSATQMLNDVNTGADLYFFAQDQFARLVKGGALSALPDSQASTVASENISGVVAAGKAGSKQYAYPLTNDNGYFMYYDKSVIPEEDVDSLEALIADCEAANRYIAFEVKGNAWYASSFFFGTGCHSEWITDDDGTFISIDDDFNSNAGLIAVKGLQKLVQSKAFVNSAKAEEFANRAAIVVSGNWDYVNAQSILGNNLGVTDLPSFTVDGKEYHLGSFSGCKLLGVKPQSDGDRAAAIHILAEYLTSEAAQTERFEALAWGPANRKAAAAAASPALSALSLQNQYATPQHNINGDWWSIAGAIADEVAVAGSDADLKAALQNYDDKISAVFVKIAQQANNPTENTWGVVGSMTGWGSDAYDYPMTDMGDGTWMSELLYLHAGDELRCRLNSSWDVNYGSDGRDGANVVVQATGYYNVILDLNAGLVYLW